MFWYDHDLAGWGWFAMSAGMILVWALIILAVVWLIRTLVGTTETREPTTSTSEHLLAERFARGQIDEQEYRQRLDTLHATGHATKH
jgi:putative membrane protein